MWLRPLVYTMIVLVVIELPIVILWLVLFHTEVEFSSILQKQDVIGPLFTVKRSAKHMERTGQLPVVELESANNIEGLDLEKLFANMENIVGRHLKILMTRIEGSQNFQVSFSYAQVLFPKSINVSNDNVIKNPTVRAKKYVFVNALYTDQLSKNTRAFLSLCAQAALGGRSVVRPLVKDTKLGSNEAWLSLAAYYDTKSLDSLLAAAGYASLVDMKEYNAGCPSSSRDHVTIHFIDDSKASRNFATSHFHLEDGFYDHILKNTILHNGWTRCAFLDRKMNRKQGKQFCVNGDIIKEWQTLEKDVLDQEKCLNIYLWRGTDGTSYRQKFSEDNFEFSSNDLEYALKPGPLVMKEVRRFRETFLSSNYIAVYIRGEFIVRGRSLMYLRRCIGLVLQVVLALKGSSGISRVYVASDMSEYGSGWLASYWKRKNLKRNIFRDIYDLVISKSQGVSYSPQSSNTDRGIVALVDMTLTSKAQYLISIGSGTFLKWITAKFLENHRNDENSWAQITVCR